MHFLPFKGKLEDIIKNNDVVERIGSIDEIQKLFKENKKYLFLQINNEMFSIDTKFGKPRLFRELFAEFFGGKERGDWKEMDKDKELMEESGKEIENLKEKWRRFHLKPIE